VTCTFFIINFVTDSNPQTDGDRTFATYYISSRAKVIVFYKVARVDSRLTDTITVENGSGVFFSKLGGAFTDTITKEKCCGRKVFYFEAGRSVSLT